MAAPPPATPLPTRRADLIARLAEPRRYDLAIVGGGATGLGLALDAALRGLSVLLLESHDFAKGTSSRATKLAHGGVRYLAQGNLPLVREALRERAALLRNAPHLAQPLPFVMPSYHCWETPFYGLGLKLYEALAGSASLGRTELLSRAETLACLPGARPEGLLGGVKYWDGQFDDARYALALARTAAAQGALLVNYCAVTDLVHDAGRVVGLRCQDRETGAQYRVQAGCVVNATGAWVDALRQQDGTATGRPVTDMVQTSQGVHLVVDADFWPGGHALLVPRTRDGRVLFAVPWLGKLLLGTTDTPRADRPIEPRPLAEEVAFILRESARYLRRAPSRADVRSLWAGLRPLLRPLASSGAHPSDSFNDGPGARAGANAEVPTRSLSREHALQLSPSGLVSVAGGKWTTYRAMAADVLDCCRTAGLVQGLSKEVTANFRLLGAPAPGAAIGPVPVPLTDPPGPQSYGTEAGALWALPGADRALGGGLTEAMVRFAARHEYARCVEDVLARRARLLFLDAQQAASLAEPVARILAEETGRDPALAEFLALARQFADVP